MNIDFGADGEEMRNSAKSSQRSGGEYADHEEYSEGSDYQNELTGFSQHNSDNTSIVDNYNRRSG